MSTDSSTEPGTWSLARSIILELDLSLAFLTDTPVLAALSTDEINLSKAIPEDWLSAWTELWRASEKYHDILETAAFLTGSLEGDDYSQVTRTIRELTLESALEHLTHQAAILGLPPLPELSPLDSLDYLFEQIVIATYVQSGFTIDAEGERLRRMKQDLTNALRIITGGDLHTRFWQLLDRFYYEFYRPWRETRIPEMEQREAQARTALGAQDQIPPMDWLPAQSPLLRHPELRDSVLAKNLHVTFWVEPFGLADSWSLWPGRLTVTFAKAGNIYESFQTFAKDVATRASALGDPTRLTILRMIRNFGMVNTEIAKFLELSQPTVSVHAKILREAGLIQSKQVGRLVRHEINASEVRRLFRDLERFLDLPEE
jgi:DNA-binding transcriptional ArsR family regulator